METVQDFNEYLISNNIDIKLNNYLKEVAIRYHQIDITELIDSINSAGITISSSILINCGLTHAVIMEIIEQLGLIENVDYNDKLYFTYDSITKILGVSNRFVTFNIEEIIWQIICNYMSYQHKSVTSSSKKMDDIQSNILNIKFELSFIREEVSGEMDALREELETLKNEMVINNKLIQDVLLKTVTSNIARYNSNTSDTNNIRCTSDANNISTKIECDNSSNSIDSVIVEL